MVSLEQLVLLIWVGWEVYFSAKLFLWDHWLRTQVPHCQMVADAEIHLLKPTPTGDRLEISKKKYLIEIRSGSKPKTHKEF